MFIPFSTTTTTFNNWDAGDPNNGGPLQNEDCALIKPDGKWNDYPCKDRFNYICKRKPREYNFLFFHPALILRVHVKNDKKVEAATGGVL